MSKWTDIKVEQIEGGRDRCEWCGALTDGEGGGLEAHHGVFSAKKRHPEYNCKENMIILCHRCNFIKALDNDPGRIFSLWHLVELFGKEHMKSWLKSLRSTHKDHTDIEFFIRELEE